MAPPPQRGGSGARDFKVLLRGFACEDLPQVGQGGGYYLRVDVGGKRSFQTQQAQGPDPAWSFEAGFGFSPSEKLGLGDLRVECLSGVDGRSMGQASVDLDAVASGPPSFRMPLHDARGAAIGAVVFDCVMRQFSDDLTVTCKNLKLTQAGLRGPIRLQVRPTLGDMFSTEQVPMAQRGGETFTAGPCPIGLEASLGDLLQAPQREGLRFAVLDGSGACRGEASLAFRRAFSAEPGAATPFSVPVLAREDGAALGSLEGALSYRGLPAFAQMVGGACIDGCVEGGWLLHEGLRYPGSLEQPPPAWEDASLGEGPDLFQADAPSADGAADAFSRISEIDDQALLEALEQIPLPRPWEIRLARGKQSPAQGRAYFADPRSRRSTWTDPRLLSEDWDQRIDMQTARVYFACHKTRQTTFVDPRGCPPGWEMRLSRSGDVYFAHHPSEQTTCIDPRGLPEHVEAALDAHGRMYFKNHDTEGTAWDDPRASEEEGTLEEWRSAELTRWWKERVWKFADGGGNEMDLDV